MSDAQGNLTRNPKKVLTLATEILTKIIELPDHPSLDPPEKSGIDQGIAAIRLTPQALLMPEKKLLRMRCRAARGYKGLRVK